jgi:hypothetical protein
MGRKVSWSWSSRRSSAAGAGGSALMWLSLLLRRVPSNDNVRSSTDRMTLDWAAGGRWVSFRPVSVCGGAKSEGRSH